MNLTKLFVAGLCFTAMTASAVTLKSDSFESGFGSGWEGTPSGAIVDGTNGVAEADSPMDTTDTKVLQLDTQGGVWTNQVNESFATTNIFVDMLVKFVPSDADSLPAISSDVKLAIAMTNGYLIVTKSNEVDGNDWATTQSAIDTSLWYRVTVKLSPGDNAYNASVTLNGSEQVSVGGETVFQIFDSSYQGLLNSIGFQGTGYIDEVVVRDDDPFAGGSVTITLAFATGISSVYDGATQKTTGETVASGTTIDITAASFYEIADVTGASTNWTVDGVGEATGSVTLTSTTNTTVTITAQAETSEQPYAGSGSFTNYPANDVATWAIANGVTELTEGMYNNYLLNIDDQAMVPAMNITSVTVSGTTVTVTVTVDSVNLAQINGTLKIKTYETLGGAETVTTAVVTGHSPETTISQDIGETAKFVKVIVE